MNKKLFRPAGPPGRGDKYLRDVARDVQRVIRTAQHDYHDESLRQSMIARSPSIVYRYRKDLLDQAVAGNERQYREFLDFHGGKQLVVYPDGLSMAADEQRRFRLMYEARSRKDVDRVMVCYSRSGASGSRRRGRGWQGICETRA